MPYSDPEKRKINDKLRYKRNKKAGKNWYRENKERRKEYLNKPETKEKIALYRAKKKTDIFHKLKLVQRSAKRRARMKKLSYSLPKDWVFKKFEVQGGKCQVTGVALKATGENNCPYLPSIDRIDSTQGYTEDNAQLVCAGFNLMKNACSPSTASEFLKDLISVCRPMPKKNKETDKDVE